jgi:hypothetical protein
VADSDRIVEPQHGRDPARRPLAEASNLRARWFSPFPTETDEGGMQRRYSFLNIKPDLGPQTICASWP